jgi:hypothetical protein
MRVISWQAEKWSASKKTLLHAVSVNRILLARIIVRTIRVSLVIFVSGLIYVILFENNLWELELKLNFSPRRFRARKVAGSIPDGVTGIFHPSGRTMALRLTQPLTEISTKNISWGVMAAGE